MTDRDGLIARIQQLRRPVAARARSSSDASQSSTARIQALETRVSHLERQLAGLQDSVYRESERHARLITELQAQVQPARMGAALAQDARSRGL